MTPVDPTPWVTIRRLARELAIDAAEIRRHLLRLGWTREKSEGATMADERRRDAAEQSGEGSEA